MAHETDDAAAMMALAALQRRWWGAALLATVALAGGYVWIRAAWDAGAAARWSLPAAAALVFVLTILWRNLPHNHLPSQALLPGLGPANWVTILRAILLALLAGFILLPRPAGALAWIPAILYTVAIAADLLDGALARLTDRVTVLGATLDMEFDGLGVLVAVGLAVRYGQLPWPYLAVGLARYLFVAGLWWLKRRGRPTHDLTPSALRRIAAGLQMAFISVILWPLFGPPATFVAGACFGVPFLAGFTRDWLVVSGTVHPAAASYRRVMGWYARLATWLPPALRLSGAALAVGILGRLLWGRVLPASYLTLGPSGEALAGVAGALALVMAALLAVGAVNRLAALGLLAATCADLAVRGYQPYHAVLLAAIIGLLYLGGGAYALWPVDDALFERRAAVRRDAGARHQRDARGAE